LKPKEAFQFVTASYLVRIGNQKASSLVQLQRAIEDCSDDSIFYHTFQSLGRHHFLTEGFSNDFAQWVLDSCNRPALAEQLASLDIRDYVSLADLRGDLRRMLNDYCLANQREASQSAFETFYFCETVEEEIPLGNEAWTLEEFRSGLDKLPHGAMQFHFLTSRLRLHLRTNDFSQWLSKELGLKELARKVDQIDIYTNTLDSARTQILTLIDREIRK
jgi:Family of unknown function (DUF5752)